MADRWQTKGDPAVASKEFLSSRFAVTISALIRAQCSQHCRCSRCYWSPMLIALARRTGYRLTLPRNQWRITAGGRRISSSLPTRIGQTNKFKYLNSVVANELIKQTSISRTKLSSRLVGNSKYIFCVFFRYTLVLIFSVQFLVRTSGAFD